jgi:hypothetical protein
VSTSGTVTYSVTEEDIIKDALIEIGYLDASETPSASDIATARRKLNMLVKQWTGQLDFAPGLKMWTRRRAYLFLQDGQSSYSLGPSGDHATETYVQTTISEGAPPTWPSVDVVSFEGMTTGDFIGVVLDDGTVHWTTISGAPGATITLTDSLPAVGASRGNAVFTYTTKMRRPFQLDTVVRRDISGNDSVVDSKMTIQEYEAIYSKTGEGSPSRLYFEAQRTNAKVYLDCAPEDCSEVLRMVYLSYIEDFSDQTDDAEFPAEWFRALSLQLASDCCRPFGRSVPKDLKEDLQEALAMARKAYAETIVLEYQSDPDCY